MSKHTPGPWIAVGAWVEHPDDSIPDICTCDQVNIGQEGRSDEEMRANARLIAAAPELLEAAQHLSCWIEVLLHALDTEMDGFVLELSNHKTGASTTISLKEHFENASAAIAKAGDSA